MAGTEGVQYEQPLANSFVPGFRNPKAMTPRLVLQFPFDFRLEVSTLERQGLVQETQHLFLIAFDRFLLRTVFQVLEFEK